MPTSISYASLKADRPGSVNIYEGQLAYEKDCADRPWLTGFYGRLEVWAQQNLSDSPENSADGYASTDEADVEDLHRADAVWRKLGYLSRANAAP